MANFYFEINDSLASKWQGGKYFMTSKDTLSTLATTSSRLLEHSDRAWCEQEGYVWYIKHRGDPTLEVDMKEFMWIKLKAETIRG